MPQLESNVTRTAPLADSARSWAIMLSVAVVLLGLYAWLYLPLLADDRGLMAADYALFLPNFLAGYFWFLENGPWALPWFSPGECGGVPFFADPNVPWFSLPQFLSFLITPVRAVKVTFLIFAVAGFLSAYGLVRVSFGGSVPASLIGSTLFMFNGFYTLRMLVGHLSFHPFMLAPLFCLAVLPGAGTKNLDWAGSVLRIGVAGLVLAVMLQAGMVHVVPAVLVSTAMVALAHAAMFGGWWRSVGLGCGAIGLGAMLAAGKMVALAAWVGAFPRDNYRLPGYANLVDEFLVIFRALFFAVPDDANSHLTNGTLFQGQHEFEIGVTMVPLLLSCIAVAQYLGARPALRSWRPVLLLAAGLSLLAAIPVALNFYQSDWNALLKTLPYFRNSSNLLRWNAAFILPVIVAGAIAADRIALPWPGPAYRRSIVAAAAIVLAIVQVVVLGRDPGRLFYQSAPVVTAWAAAHRTLHPPAITAIAVSDREYADRRWGNPNANNALTVGYSHRQCYQPMFGYSNERFPLSNLTPSLVFREANGLLNMKNPACYLFSRENHCLPGAMFEIEERPALEAFVTWKPFPFVLPDYMTAVLWVNQIALLATMITMFAAVWSLARRSGERQQRQ